MKPLPKIDYRELYRKSIHVSSILLPLGWRYLLDYDRRLFVMILFPMALVALLVELFRLENPTVKRLFFRSVGIMLRRHEMSDLTGASYLLTSALIAAAFFPRDIAFCVLCFVAVGDTMAALVGKAWGKRRYTLVGKTVEGSLACFISTFIFALFFIKPSLAFTGAFLATLAEASPLPVDDNIKIPLISGLGMYLALLVTG